VPNFRLTLEYDGRGFAGWQVQPRGQRTVQGALEAAVERVTGRAVRVIGSGRTDAGVHAQGQVASLRVETRLEPDQLSRALNGVLPADVAVLGAERVPEDFHARHDARSKLYCYRIWNGASPSPLRAPRVWQVARLLDLEAMRPAAQVLVGTHDFACFRATGSGAGSSVRTLARCQLEGEARAEIRLLVEGDGFLRHMVRALVGTLVEVGYGQRPAGSMLAMLAARDRGRAGRTAPAQGLSLVRVDY
jgi:tRNA pseudouridine38-40 synthase